MQYGVQLYTLRSLPAADGVEAIATAGFDGVELVGCDPVEVGACSVVAAHVGLDEIEADPAGTVARCRANGTETLVVPILGSEAFAAEGIDGTAARLEAAAAAVADAGGRLLYHNHEFEFAADAGVRGSGPSDETPFDRLVALTTRLGFEIDVGWATAAGIDPVALIERVGDRVPIVHLKDVRVDPTAPRGGHPVDLGVGDVDLRGCLRAAETAGVEWVVFEHDAPDDPVKSVRDAAAWLRTEPSGPR
jgi:sugar phosphate isomerase/epimerase